jgi:hypothetical protein
MADKPPHEPLPARINGERLWSVNDSKCYRNAAGELYLTNPPNPLAPKPPVAKPN